MSCIYYKFKSGIEYKTLRFDGLHVSVADLKRQIAEKEKIVSTAFDLQLMNAQTKRIYETPDELIPRKSSLIVNSLLHLPYRRRADVCVRAAGGERQRAPSPSPPPPPCAHSRWDKARPCCDCRRRRSPSVTARPSGIRAASPCRSPRDHSACRGSCRPPARDSRRDSGSRLKENVAAPPRVAAPVALAPLCTERLQPRVEVTKKAVFRILSDGVVCVEVLSDGDVTEVMRISKNGEKIAVYRPPEGCRVDISNAINFNIKRATHFNRLADLDTRYHKKYDFAYKLVQLVRAQTVKLTYYAVGAKCRLMESGAFIVEFHSGKSAEQKQECATIETADICLNEFERSTFTKLREKCALMARALSVFDDAKSSAFPAVLGSRSAATRPVAPSSVDASATARASSLPRLSKSSPMKACQIVNLRSFADGKVEMVLGGGERLTLSTDGQLSYRDPDGRCQHYTIAEKDRLPKRVRSLLKSLTASANALM